MRTVLFLFCLTAWAAPLPLKKLPTDPQTLVYWLTSSDPAKNAAAFALFRIPVNYSRPKNVELHLLQLDEDPEYEATISLRNTGAALLIDKRGANWFGTVIDDEKPGLGGDVRISSRWLTGGKHEDLLVVTEGRWEGGTGLSLRLFTLRPDGFHTIHEAQVYDVEWDMFTSGEIEQLGQIQKKRHLGAMVLLDRFGRKRCAAFAWNPAIVKFVPNTDATRALCKP